MLEIIIKNGDWQSDLYMQMFGNVQQNAKKQLQYNYRFSDHKKILSSGRAMHKS